MKKWLCVLAVLMMACCMCACAYAEGSWLSEVILNLPDSKSSVNKGQRTAAVLYIDGEISRYDSSYDHYGTIDVIDALAEDSDNAALMLVLNTPGGSLYDADEVYHALMKYKATGRPVFCYMEEECCSAGVYIAMAADHIMASRMTITGSVGVYMQAISESGLYDLIGIENEYIATGENKVPGYPSLTPEQREIYQALVDESFEIFKQAIADARGLDEAGMASFLDGRLLSAYQAKELGLIDDVLYLDEAQEYVCFELENSLGESVTLENVTPEPESGFDFMDLLDNSGPIDWLDMFTGSAGRLPLDSGCSVEDASRDNAVRRGFQS